MSNGETSTYRDLIEEAFIQPIRSVIVVDDEFPTLDGLLEETPDTAPPPLKPIDRKRVREIIRFCHQDVRRWMVEVHDGLPESQNTTSHLTQADLMILDFHLDKERPSDPTKAIDILRRLDDNDYFNLVIVYTKGDEEAGGDIARVVREIAIGLCAEDERLIYDGKGFEKAVGDLKEWEDDDENIKQKLLDAIDDWTFLRIRTSAPGDIDWTRVCDLPEMQELKRLVDGAPKSISSKLKSFAKWAAHERQRTLRTKMASKDCKAVSVGPDPRTGMNWIRTDRLFVTVASKTHEASTLPQMLLAALEDWDPEPHRLLMCKMRAVLDERGVLAEEEVLGNQCLQMGWLKEYLCEDANNRAWTIHNAITRHWEGLGDAIREEIMKFAGRLGQLLTAYDPGDLISRWYLSLDPAEVSSHINRYACSKLVRGRHLAIGQVLRISGSRKGDQYWLCLTPACDLEPNRLRSGWPDRLGSHMPFIAVELYRANRQEALSRAHGGNHLFLEIDEQVSVFSFTPSPKTGSSGEHDAKPSPKWEQMFAADQGIFNGADGRELTILRAAEVAGMDEREPGKRQLMLSKCSASVVAQLRYEYALNLLHRLGTTLSRVGLDFVPMSKLFPANGQIDA